MMDWIRLIPSVLISVLASVVLGAEGICNEEQINTCRDAGLSNSLESLRIGGDCSVKSYMEFTHLCVVKNYLPTVDYCCCRHNQDELLCCRYHQSWNHFRCEEDDDVISTRVSQEGALADLPPLEILLPSILIPLFCILICCIVCIVSCWCRRRQQKTKKKKKNDPTAPTTTTTADGCQGSENLLKRCACCLGARIFGTRRVSTARPERVLDPSRSRSFGEDEEDGPWTTGQLRPMTMSQLLLTSDDDPPSFYPCSCPPEDHQCPQHHLLLHHRFYTPGVEPSAPPPPADSIPSETTTEDYRFHGAPGDATSYPINEQCSEVWPRPVALCPACARHQPPPAYEESWTHRVV